MLAQRCQLPEQRESALRTSKRVAIIAKLNCLKRSFQGKLAEAGENLFLVNSRDTHLTAAGVTIPTAKKARLSDRNKHTILFYLKKDAFSHVVSLLLLQLNVETLKGAKIFSCFVTTI